MPKSDHKPFSSKTRRNCPSKNRKAVLRLRGVRDDKAVSPIVAVLLLLAITVLMAGYLGLAVLSADIAEPAPSAVLRASAVSVNGHSCIRLDHRGGDALNMSETRILFDGAPVSFDAGVTDKVFAIGDSLLIYRARKGVLLTTGSSTPPPGISDLTAPGKISELIIIDDRTNQILFEAKIY